MIWRVVTLVSGGLVAGVLGVWIGERDSPVDVHSMTVLTPKVIPGDDLKIKFEIFRRKQCDVQVELIINDVTHQRFIINPLGVFQSPGPVGLDVFVNNYDIDPRIAIGPATLQTITKYTCNPIHRLWPIILYSPVVNFEVTGRLR